MTVMTLDRVWGDSLGRLPAALSTVALTNDPAVAYALGNIDGRGQLRALDARTGETLREHQLPLLATARERVVTSTVRDDGVVLFAASDAVYALTLATGDARRLFGARTSSLLWLDDRRISLGNGAIVDMAGAVSSSPSARWRSRDGRLHLREVPESAQRRVVSLDVETGLETRSRLLDHEAEQIVVSRDGAWLARLGSTNSYNSQWVTLQRTGITRKATRDYGERLPVSTQIAATRDDGLSLIDTGRWGDGGALVADDELTAFDPEAHAGERWYPQASCVSPDGARYGWVRNGVIHVLDLERGVELTACDLHADAVRSIVLSPDASTAVTGGADGVITVWSVAPDELLWRIEAGGSVRSVALSPDGAKVYACVDSRDGDRWWSNLRVWSLTDGSEITPEPMEFLYGAMVSLTPDGARAMVTQRVPCKRGPSWVDLEAWRAHTFTWRELTRRDRQSRADWWSMATISEDGATAEVSWGESYERWRSTVVMRTGEARGVESRARMPSPTALAVEGAKYAVKALETKGFTLSRRRAKSDVTEARDESVAVTALALSRDERTLMAGTADGRVRVYRIEP